MRASKPMPSQTLQSLSLSPQDVQRLLHDSSAELRIDMVHRLTKVYDRKGLGEDETVIAEQIFRLLLKDTEVRVRGALAMELKNAAHMPRDIALKLARDVEEVSIPILRFSEVLNDEDLVDLVKSVKDPGILVAIAQRAKVSFPVSTALVNTKVEAALTSLLQNQNAQISEESLQEVIRTFPDNQGILEAMSQRAELPVTVVEKLITKVSAAFAQSLQNKYDLAPGQIAEKTQKVREDTTLGMARGVLSDVELDRLVTQLMAFGRLSPSMVLSSLCDGNIRFFEMCLSKMAQVPLKNVRILLEDASANGFRALYAKAGLPEVVMMGVHALFRAVKLVLGAGVQVGTTTFAASVIDQLDQLSRREGEIENLQYIISLVKRSLSSEGKPDAAIETYE